MSRYKAWLHDNEREIRARQRAAALTWLDDEAQRVDAIGPDALGEPDKFLRLKKSGIKDRGVAYIYSEGYDDTGRPRLNLTLKAHGVDGGAKITFDDYAVIASMWAAAKGEDVPAPDPERLARIEADRAKRQAEREQAKRERERAEQAEREANVAKARQTYEAADDLTTAHPYLTRKEIEPSELTPGIRRGEDTYGRADCLLVPLTTLAGEFLGIQSIPANGKKLYSAGSETGRGAVVVFGDLANASTIAIGEGVATCAVIHTARVFDAVVAALSTGGLEPVGEQIKERYPNATITYTADNDAWHTDEKVGNPGIRYANAAARKVGALVIAPNFDDVPNAEADKLTDFDDLARAFGLDETIRQLRLAAAPPKDDRTSAYLKRRRVDGLVPLLADELTYGSDRSGNYAAITTRTPNGTAAGELRLYDRKSVAPKLTGPKATGVDVRPHGAPKTVLHLAPSLDIALAVAAATGESAVAVGGLEPYVYAQLRAHGRRVRLRLWTDADHIGEAHRAGLRFNLPVYELPELTTDLVNAARETSASGPSPMTPETARLAFAAYIEERDRYRERNKVSTDRWLEPIPFRPGVTLVRAPQGSGKTHQIERVVAEARAAGYNVLPLTHIIKLVDQLAERLKVANYQQADPLLALAAGGLAICLPSLHKLVNEDGELPDASKTVLVVDEIEQVVRALTGKHIRNKAAVLRVLRHFWAQSFAVYGLDADLGPLAELLNEMWRNGEEIHRIENDHPIMAGRTVHIYDRPAAVLDKMVTTANEGRYVGLMTNSIKKSEQAYELLRDGDRILALINGETARDEANAKILSEPKRLEPYNGAIISPSGMTGIDIQLDVSEVFGIFNRHVGVSSDDVQGMHRYRRAKTWHMFVDPSGESAPLDDESLGARYGATYDKERELIGNADAFGVSDSDYRKIRMTVDRIERTDRRARRYNVVRQLVLQGADVWLEPTDPGDEDRLKDLAQLAHERGEDFYARNRSEARIIDADEASELRGAGLDKDSFYALELFAVRDFYRVDTTDTAELKALVLQDERGRYRRRLRTLEDALTALSANTAALAPDADDGDLAPLSEDYAPRATRSFFIARLLEQVGLVDALADLAETEGPIDEKATASTTYSVDDLAELIAWYESEHMWIKGIFRDAPTPERFAANPIRYVGTWLRLAGLNHRRVGDNSARQYALQLAPLADALGIIDRRGIVDTAALRGQSEDAKEGLEPYVGRPAEQLAPAQIPDRDALPFRVRRALDGLDKIARTPGLWLGSGPAIDYRRQLREEGYEHLAALY